MASKPKNGKPTSHNSPDSANGVPEVLTLYEAAAFLRVSEATIRSMAQRGELPGRQIKQEWRFLKSALQDWLRSTPQQTGKAAFLALAGTWKSDPDIDEIVHQALRRRGRKVSEQAK